MIRYNNLIHFNKSTTFVNVNVPSILTQQQHTPWSPVHQCVVTVPGPGPGHNWPHHCQCTLPGSEFNKILKFTGRTVI